MTGSLRRSDGTIDWDLARARLTQVQVTIDNALEPSPERIRDIMDARARALAQAPESADLPGLFLNLVLFSLGRERYGIETRFAREIVRLANLTPVPGTPDFVVGVTNIRGAILAVIDLRRLCNILQQGLTDSSRVIVLGTDRVEFGILVDEASGQANVPVGGILPPLASGLTEGRPYVRGVTAEAMIVLDGAALLADPRLTIDTTSGPAI